jgi:hypothetical protein
MSWNIHFMPDECDSISVNINGESWTTWNASEGDTRKDLPGKWANNNKIKVYAAVHPEGKNGSMDVCWDGEVRQEFRFDADEDHDVEKP